MNSDNGSRNDRTEPTAGELNNLVEGAMEYLAANADNFTAYDVTTRLRGEHTDLEINHGDVRSHVAGIYRDLGLERNFTQFPGKGGAWLYFMQSPEDPDPEDAEQPSDSGPSAADLIPGVPALVDADATQAGDTSVQ